MTVLVCFSRYHEINTNHVQTFPDFQNTPLLFVFVEFVQEIDRPVFYIKITYQVNYTNIWTNTELFNMAVTSKFWLSNTEVSASLRTYSSFVIIRFPVHYIYLSIFRSKAYGIMVRLWIVADSLGVLVISRQYFY